MKKVLFLGGSGRVGETAIRYLLDHAAVELTVVTRKTVIDTEGLCSGRSSVKNVQADITCGDTLDRLLEGTDLAVSCVGPSHTVGSFIIDAYPIVIKPLDILAVFLTVLGVGFTSVWYAVRHF